jgi:endoglucanase
MALASLSARAQGAGYWHTSGSKIVDANGVTVRLAGINWYGAETPDYLVHGLWAQDYKTVLNTIKSLGYNVIRIPFSNQLVESNPVPTNYTSYANGGVVNSQLVGQTALQDLDTIIAYAGSIGLRVILDNHRSEAGETNEASGLWYTSAYPQANWIADWKTMATRYSASTFTFNGNPTVIGMDLRNEPHLSGSGATTGSCWTGDTATNGCPVSLTAQNWPVAAEAAGNAILAINPKLLIFVEGNDCYSGVCGWQGGNLIGVANYPVTLSVANQLVYSAHDYGPNLYQQSWFNGSTTPTSLDATWNKYWGYISGAGIAPVWLGEFGTDNTNTDIESTAAGSQGQWFESLVSYLQSNPSVNWTYWALNGEDTYDLLNGNYDATPVSSLKQSLLTSIQFPLSGGSTTPGFTLAPSASALAITQGKTATDTITVTDVGGFTGSVTLAATGLPTGVTVAYGTNPTTSTSVLTFTASATATTGTATVTITGTSGSTTATTSFTLTVSSASGFPLAASPTALSVTQGSTATDTITVTDVGGFTGSVTLAASGLPSGVTAAFGTNPATSTSVLTLTASSTATTGTSTVTITGTSGSTTATTTISLTVTSSACTPTTIVPYISVNGGSTWTEESAATVSSTTTAVDLGPQPTTGTWSWTGPNGFTSTARQINSIALSTGANVYVATYTNSNSCKSTEPFTITVTGTTPSFTLAPSASTLAITQGKTATDTVTVTDVGGFTGSVTLAATGLPSGVTVAYGTNPTTGSSVLTFTASSTAPVGTSTVTITGTSGSTTATTTINLTVSASGFTLAPSASALAITQGKTATDTITVTDVGGFTGSVTLAASGLPSGVTVAYGTNPTTSTSVLTFTATSTATTGTATVTITGTSGSTTATTTIALTVGSGGGGACTVDYVISPQNSSAFGAAITIVNGPTAITSWTLAWSFANGQTVASLWNGIETQSGANVTVKNESYNGSIAAGGTLTGIGFNGTWNGTTNAIPTAFSLNGTACTVN